MSQVLDEQLIDEVAQHGVIFNRQKYYLNGSGSAVSNGSTKYETKDEAWQTIAMKLRTDVETCKKRWKYLRERYVSQRKQCDPPVYEHLSRPYLEKMKFLDQHIQPRKSYRNVPSFLPSPHSANSSTYSEFNMDSKSNSSMKNLNPFANGSQPSYNHASQEHAQAMNALTTAAAALENPGTNGQVKIEADVFRDFAAAVASHQLQHISQSQMPHHQHHHHNQVAAVAAAMAADSSQNFQEHFRDGSATNVLSNAVSASGGGPQGSNNGTAGIPSSSSSMKSPLSSPLPTNGQNGTGHSSSSLTQQAAAHSSTSQMAAHGYSDCTNVDLDTSTSSGFHAKKPRLQMPATGHNGMTMNGNNSNAHTTANTSGASNNHYADDTDDDSDDNSSNIMHPQTILHEHSPHNHFDGSSASTSNSTLMQQRSNATTNNNNNTNINHNGNNNNHAASQQNMFPANADFLFQLYQQLPHQAQTAVTNHHHQHHQQHHQQQPQQQSHSHHQFNKIQTSSLAPPSAHTSNMPQRCSEHLLGELVTTELLKMNKDKRKNVQKRILEILFFDD